MTTFHEALLESTIHEASLGHIRQKLAKSFRGNVNRGGPNLSSLKAAEVTAPGTQHISKKALKTARKGARQLNRRSARRLERFVRVVNRATGK